PFKFHAVAVRSTSRRRTCGVYGNRLISAGPATAPPAHAPGWQAILASTADPVGHWGTGESRDTKQGAEAEALRRGERCRRSQICCLIVAVRRVGRRRKPLGRWLRT